MNPVGEGTASNESSAIPVTTPSSPSIASVTPGNAQIALVWSAPASDGGSPITGLRVYRGTTSCGGVLLTTVGDVLPYTDTGLTNGQTYYYKVSAVNGVGECSLSDEASATPVTVPTAPRNLVVRVG